MKGGGGVLEDVIKQGIKIGVVSDTHGIVRPEVKEWLKECDLILHGGDINNPMVLGELNSIAPVKVVRGNNDFEWANHIPYNLVFEFAGLRICMAHMKRDLPSDISEFDLVILGHTHKYLETKQGNTTILNPGSCGPRKFGQAVTLALIDVIDRKMSIKRIEIPQ